MDEDLSGIVAEREYPLVARYKAEILDDAYRIDFLVAGRLVVELKTVERILPLHRSQVLTYLRWTNCQLGLLINFNVPLLRDGVSGVINKSFL